MTRLNGREPKKPREADKGLGCALDTAGTPGSSVRMLSASFPHKTATSGKGDPSGAPGGFVVGEEELDLTFSVTRV